MSQLITYWFRNLIYSIEEVFYINLNSISIIDDENIAEKLD